MNPQRAHRIRITVVNEHFLVERHFAANTAEVDACQPALTAVGIHHIENVALRHHRQRTNAEFTRLVQTGSGVNQLLAELELINQRG